MKPILLAIGIAATCMLLARISPALAQSLEQNPTSPKSSSSSAIVQTTESNQQLFAGRNFDTWAHLLDVDLDEYTRVQAIKAIGVLGSKGRQERAFQILSPLIRSENRGLAYAAHQALAVLSDKGVELLVSALQDDAYPYRESIIQSLGKAGPTASAATPELLLIARRSDVVLRRRAFEALIAIGQPEAPIIEAIEQEVERNDDSHLSTPTILGLAKSPISYEAKELLLVRLLNGADRTVVQYAATALAQIGQQSEAVKVALRNAIRAYAIDPGRRGACPNVSADGVNVDLLLPILIEVVKEQDLTNAAIRDGAFIRLFVDQIDGLGDRAAPAVPVLTDILAARKSPRMAQIDLNVLRTLWSIGNTARPALPTLEKLRQEVAASDAYQNASREVHLQSIDRTIRRIQDSLPGATTTNH